VPLLVHTDHGRHLPDPWWARSLDAMAARRTDVVVAVSDALARQLAATVVPRGTRVRVIVNGVDTERFRPQPTPLNGSLRRTLGLPEGAPVIGSVGRFAPVKGYDVMIEAFALLCAGWRERPLPRLVLVGDGVERVRLAALIDQRALGDAVRLAGWQRDVEQVYPVFDVFTLSSRSEGTPLGLLEAMSTGVCPVVTDVGGSAAVLGEGLRHRLVPPEDPRALAAAWRDALADPERRCRDATAARARVEQAFALHATIRAYERIYLREP
jgi:glycosyltransferase involved in cell wall biosynthesis